MYVIYCKNDLCDLVELHRDFINTCDLCDLL